MAPSPDTATSVYIVDYSFEGGQRQLQCRYLPVAGIDTALGYVQAFLNQLLPVLCTDWTILGARVRSAGSSITLPAVAPILSGAPSGGALDDFNRPRFHSFIGRGNPSGRRARVYVYGIVGITPTAYRIPAPLPEALEDARTVLTAAQEGSCFTDVDGDAVTWYEYVNVGYNGYWEKDARRS